MRFLVLAALLVSCAEPAVPAKANEHWQRLRTEHFDLATDLPAEDAKKAADALERTRHALLEAAWPQADDRLTERTTVVVLRDKIEYDHYQHGHTFGLYTWAARPTIFLFGLPDRWAKRTALSDESSTSVLRHELTHRLAAGIYGRQPRWFAEGLAQFLETTDLSEDGKTATLGRVNLVALRKYHACRESSVADVLAWREMDMSDQRMVCSRYGTSWLLVHYLYNQKPTELAAYQTKLARGVDPARAFKESFPDIQVESFDQELNRYSNYGNFTELPRPVTDIQVAVAEAPITAADVEAIRAQLALVSDMKDEAKTHIRESLSLERGNSLALRVEQLVDHALPADAVARLQDQVAHRPDDADAWRELGRLLPSDREPALRKAMALEPRNADYVEAVAAELVKTGRVEQALPLATKAAMLAPWSSRTLDTYAATLAGMGRCPEALTVEKRALDLLAEHASAAEAAPVHAKIAEYEKCGAAATP